MTKKNAKDKANGGGTIALHPVDQQLDLALVQQQLAGAVGVGDHVRRG